ncbi:iduronate sulfatase [Acetobacter orientalis]|uniref:Iduronate sulfatase n=1 Tax=Acetobacter orientalis TaxID=146474 RepID=A0A2Z5ZLR6_9PROT|nr:iduronate sulfatase [Acetobacter orientalis]
MVLIRKRYLTLTASTHIMLMLGLCVLVQAPLAFAGHAQSYTVPPLAHAALENKSSAQVAAQGVTARVVIETSHRCGGPMVWQSGDAQPLPPAKWPSLLLKKQLVANRKARVFCFRLTGQMPVCLTYKWGCIS